MQLGPSYAEVEGEGRWKVGGVLQSKELDSRMGGERWEGEIRAFSCGVRWRGKMGGAAKANRQSSEFLSGPIADYFQLCVRECYC